MGTDGAAAVKPLLVIMILSVAYFLRLIGGSKSCELLIDKQNGEFPARWRHSRLQALSVLQATFFLWWNADLMASRFSLASIFVLRRLLRARQISLL